MSKTAPARPRLPSGLSVALLIAKMSLRRARRGKLLRVVAVLLLLPPATVLIGVLSGRSGGQMFEFALELFLRYLAPLALALGASASVAEEAQAKTITYLFTRPMPRWALPFGKFLSTAAANSVLLLISLVICFGVAMIGGPQGVLDRLALLGSGMFALVLAALYFGAMANAFGAMVTNSPFAVMLIYLLAIDVSMAFVPRMKVISMCTHLLATVGLYRPSTGLLADPRITPTVATIVLLCVTTAWVAITIAVTSTREYRTDR
jgi:ABC-type transport system involved in multi-copper enzyme maturation permease subunit